eukprot:TRINITY_DN6437_c0_g1_i2.p1 TRINITY_DN6437_c0_g1~~TRINITY_DN6437_c0_g1_i2.p1  ORF type:complete len:331 (+),score=56.93 TRINITY_DN6437_c0_g1_i2:144-1136(+)
MIRRPPRSTHCISSAASDVYKRQQQDYVNSLRQQIDQSYQQMKQQFLQFYNKIYDMLDPFLYYKQEILESLKTLKVQKFEDLQYVSGFGDIISQRYNLTIRNSEFNSIMKNGWLSSLLIDFYSILLNQYSKAHSDPFSQQKLECYIFKTQVYAYLRDNNSDLAYSQMNQARPQNPFNIFSKYKRLGYPLNVDGNHWVFVYVDNEKKIVTVANSLFDIFEPKYRNLLEKLKPIMTKDGEDHAKYQFIQTNAPQQTNGYDCGIFVCKNMQLWMQGHPITSDSFTQSEITAYRKNLFYIIAYAMSLGESKEPNYGIIDYLFNTKENIFESKSF